MPTGGLALGRLKGGAGTSGWPCRGCNIDWSNYFYYLFFSFVLIELKPLVLKGKVLGEKV